ncbi:MAG: MerR family transcriptional regulator [Anaerovoracaceae bacterium]
MEKKIKEDFKNYFTTGEFASLCKVKKQTLFHYDEIGILKPHIVGANGYRYYTYEQLDIFFTITMLKELDMPLSHIKIYMDNRSPKGFIKLLKMQEKEVERKMEHLVWLKHYIKTKIKITQEGISVKSGEITIQTCPAEYLVITKYAGDEEEKNIATGVSNHINFCHDLDIYSAYAIGGMIPSAEMSAGNYIYSHFYTKVNKSDFEGAFRRSKGLYAVCYDSHGYDNMEVNCANLIAYAKEHNYTPGPYFYEDLLLDEMSAKGYDDYTLKISISLI